MIEHKRLKAVIDLGAVKENFSVMKNGLRPGTQIVAVVKADGYGHGAVPIAEAVEHFDYIWGFAVATAEEALELRTAGIKKPVLILGVVFDEYFEALAEEDIRIQVMDADIAVRYARACGRVHKKGKIHIALDTGMSRIGFADRPESIEEIRKISEIPNLEIEGIFTHFARADETDLSPAVVQLQKFQHFTSLLEQEEIRIPLHHCANSAAILRMPEASLDLARAGIMIYGIYPSEEVERERMHIRPVMSLISHVSFVKEVPAGTAISYGGTFVTKRPSVIATIPAGYADGYPRQLSNKGYVLIHGKRAPICGRVCMDQFMADVTDIEDVKEGDRVTLLGSDGGETITAEFLGDLSGRFSYEFVCDIGKRVPRVYIE